MYWYTSLTAKNEHSGRGIHIEVKHDEVGRLSTLEIKYDREEVLIETWRDL